MTVGVVLLVSAPTLEEANSKASSVETHRCTRSKDYCIVIEYTEASPHRVPLIIAHKVSGKKGHASWARWTYRKSGGGSQASGWKKSSWTGDNGRAPGVAVETLCGHSGRAGGPMLTQGTVCTQFKGSKQKACFRLD